MPKSIMLSLSVAVLLILVCFPYGLNTCEAAESDSTSLMARSDVAIKTAFNELLEAEQAGVNITDMLVMLNQSVNLLAQMENSNQSLTPTELNSNLSRIQVAYERAQYVETNARSAKLQALNVTKNVLLTTLVFSLIAAISFILILFVFWRRFKQRYKRKLLLLKPEVDDNKS